MNFSIPIGPSRSAARGTLVGLALAGACLTGLSSASASVHPDINLASCTKVSPEICVGVNYTSNDVIENVQVQVNLPYYSSDVHYTIALPQNEGSITLGPYSGGPGWVTPQAQVNIGAVDPGLFCGTAIAAGHPAATAACVNAP